MKASSSSSSTSSDRYNIKPRPGTRDHRGFFVQETIYRLTEVTETGWAKICLDNAACYYVNPADVSTISDACTL